MEQGENYIDYGNTSKRFKSFWQEPLCIFSLRFSWLIFWRLVWTDLVMLWFILICWISSLQVRRVPDSWLFPFHDVLAFKCLKEEVPSDKSVDHQIAFISATLGSTRSLFLKRWKFIYISQTKTNWRQRKGFLTIYFVVSIHHRTWQDIPNTLVSCLNSARVWKLSWVSPEGRDPSSRFVTVDTDWEVTNCLLSTTWDLTCQLLTIVSRD